MGYGGIAESTGYIIAELIDQRLPLRPLGAVCLQAAAFDFPKGPDVNILLI